MIRVVIDRKVAESLEREFHEAIHLARSEAVSFPGFVSAETLREVGNHAHHIVLSTWRSTRDWELWCKSEHRLRLLAAIAPCLEEPETVTLYEPM